MAFPRSTVCGESLERAYAAAKSARRQRRREPLAGRDAPRGTGERADRPLRRRRSARNRRTARRHRRPTSATVTCSARHLVEQEGRDCARVAERLVVVPDEPLDQLDGVGVDDLLVMLGSEAVSPPRARTDARRTRRGRRTRS